MALLTWWIWVWASSAIWWWMGSLAGCSPWGDKESDSTEWTKLHTMRLRTEILSPILSFLISQYFSLPCTSILDCLPICLLLFSQHPSQDVSHIPLLVCCGGHRGPCIAYAPEKLPLVWLMAPLTGVSTPLHLKLAVKPGSQGVWAQSAEGPVTAIGPKCETWTCAILMVGSTILKLVS